MTNTVMLNTRLRGHKFISASISANQMLSLNEPWTLKQVQGDDHFIDANQGKQRS